MQINGSMSLPVLRAGPVLQSKAQAASGELHAAENAASPSGRRFDFTRITPRELGEQLSEWIWSGQLSVEEASFIGGALPTNAYRDSPDVPIDLFATINGISEFHTYMGDPEGASFWLEVGSKLRYLETNTRGISEQA